MSASSLPSIALVSGAPCTSELAERDNRQLRGVGGVKLLEVAIHLHLAERRAASVDGADVDEPVSAGRTALRVDRQVGAGKLGVL